MCSTLAVDALENFVLATPRGGVWFGFASNAAFGLLFVWLVALVAYLVLLLRPPSRARVVSGWIAATGFNVFMPAMFASLALSYFPPALRAILLVVPLIALVFVVRGIFWIACHWRVFDATRCSGCGHQLLREQLECPECGVSRVFPSVLGWGSEQSRVAARTALALLCVMISLYAIGALGAIKLEWRAKLFVELFDEKDSELATILADAIVVERPMAVDFNDGYGLNGPIREVSGAFSVPPSAVGQAVFFVPLGPRDDRAVDEAWLASLRSRLASFPPASADAAEDWLRTITARLDGKRRSFSSNIAKVVTTIDLRYPSILVILAVLCAGPVGAALAALAWKRFMARLLRNARATTKLEATKLEVTQMSE